MPNTNSKVRLLIVEDELLLAQDIADRLTDLGYLVVGIVNSAHEALRQLDEGNEIDLVLLDIVLEGTMDGIELARLINRQYDIPFVFLTSHADAYFIERAKSVRPYAYLLKPFNDRQVMIAIEVALLNYMQKRPVQNLLQPPAFEANEHTALKIKDSLFLKKEHHFQRVTLKEILFLQAENNYTAIHTLTKKYMYSIVLKKVAAQLPQKTFLRVHRSYIVNIHLVTGFEGNLLYVDDQKIPIGKSYKQRVFSLFQTI